ncbi:dedicator of cytokinesis protein 1 isoform X1 [Hydra vulgaris]|uniref:dedicator of cytokinesis protein 1 isoform X1 n=1 Tax=Hydra vulgaris TaxID=6087 RepID=UPI001F5F5CB5|nr:dedicator of cytokinesis protein 1 isoform X1 [Hydra vulgaris]
MVIWRSTGSVKYGVAISKFDVHGAYFLQIGLGEAVLIEEVTDDCEWYRGCLFLNQNYKGIFPVSYIHIKDWSINCERIHEVDMRASKEISVVLEITSVLKEWGTIWKTIFVKNSEKIDSLRKHLFDLISWRRQVVSGALTADQLKKVKLEVARIIDYGNRFLGLDLVIRDSSGTVLDVASTGVIDIYKRNLESSQRTETPMDIQTTMQSHYSVQSTHSIYNIYICIKNVVCKVGDDTEVLITLYDGRENNFISEHFLIYWDKKGMPKDITKFSNLSCVFTDLGLKDLERDKLYIVCQIIREGRMDIKDNDSLKFTQKLRRPFAVAVLHVSDIVQGKALQDSDKEYCLQLNSIPSNEDIDSTIKKCIQKSTNNNQGTGQGIWLTLQLIQGDLQQIKEEHPLLISQYTAVARKQGFPDVIMPGDVRNDMYITLLSGNFEKGGKSSNKNIQVILTVYDSEGQLMENVIVPGAGEPPRTEYNSTVYYHNATPKWSEVVKLEIPIEKIKYGSHIRFSFKHRATIDEKDRSQKAFSLSYVNLIGENETCLQDAVHELAVYKCDSKKLDNCLSYLKLPSLKSDAVNQQKKLGNSSLSYSKTEVLKIGFQLCSTKLAQNVDLLGLLKWRRQKEKLHQILPALVNVSGQEIVKFLQDTFDALFAILMDDPAQYGEKVVEAVVFCIGLLADKKYHNFRSILDAYIENLFSSTKAYITLIEMLQKNIEIAHSQELSADMREHIIKYFKALEYLVKFIVRSRSLSERAAPGKARPEFETSIMNLLSSVITMMKMTNNQVLPLQGCALKYMPSVFGDLLELYNAAELGLFACDLIERIPPTRLPTQKLTCIHHLVKCPLFSNPISRQVVLKMIVGQLKASIEKFEELKVCADILNEMLSSFYRITEVGDTDYDISYISTNLFHCIIRSVIRMNPASQLLGNYVTFVICILDLMKDNHYEQYLASYDSDLDLLDGLMELFLVIREFIKGNVFPPDWTSMIMIQNTVILRALNYFSEALYDKFLVKDSFQFQLWDNFFQLSVSFITQDALQLESFTETKRNKILANYDDMRMNIGLKIIDMWQWLGINKIRLIQNMVRPFLEMTLIPETDLRRATIPIFFDMIECEFRTRQHFKQVESEVIIHLDHLVETGSKGDEEYKELFSEILTEKFLQQKQQNPRLYELGVIFVQTIKKLLSRLLDYCSVIRSEDNINNRMSCTVNILNFYQEIRREEMKERYLYKLCDLHISVGSYTEAAFTLLQHAELLKWSDEPLTNNSITSSRYQAKTHRELKEKLYKEIIDFFDKGKMWEYGINKCKELANQYECETYDYIQLSEILKKEAVFFENIIKTVVRPEPTYFRVGYYGRGFPTFLRNKVFVYRGNEFESLSDFSMRLKVQFPGGQFLKTLEAPGPEITESIGQSIQVCKVDPKPVERRKFQGKPIVDQIKKFYEVNDVSAFALNRPFHKGVKDKDNEFATLWIERTTMNTEYSFPGKLRWFEVTSSNTVELSPMENAVDTLHSKNKELLTVINQYEADRTINLSPLSMLLNGVIDAAVMGGISNYEKLFFTKSYIAEHPEHLDMIAMLKEAIVEQVEICEKGLKIHKELVTKELEPFHKQMESVFKDNKAKVAPYKKIHINTPSRLRVSSEMPNEKKNVLPPSFPHKRSTTIEQRNPIYPEKHRPTDYNGSLNWEKNENRRESIPQVFASLPPKSLPVSPLAVPLSDEDLPPALPKKPQISFPNLSDTPPPPPKPVRYMHPDLAIHTPESVQEDDEGENEEEIPVLPAKKSNTSQYVNVQQVEKQIENPEEEISPPPVPPRAKLPDVS